MYHAVFGTGRVTTVDRGVLGVNFGPRGVRRLVPDAVTRLAGSDATSESGLGVTGTPQSKAPRPPLRAGASVVFTGDGPYAIDDLISLLPGEARAHREAVPSTAILVIGQLRWVSDVIRAVMADPIPTLRVLPQEAFVDLLAFGHDWWTEAVDWLEWSVHQHEGLAFAKSLASFPWPTTDVVTPSGRAAKDDADGRYAPESALHLLGYQISGMDRDERWTCLASTAVPQLGLRRTAETIAMLVRARKQQRGGRRRYRHAIREWETDLRRLKREFYRPGRSGFRWPST